MLSANLTLPFLRSARLALFSCSFLRPPLCIPVSRGVAIDGSRADRAPLCIAVGGSVAIRGRCPHRSALSVAVCCAIFAARYRSGRSSLCVPVGLLVGGKKCQRKNRNKKRNVNLHGITLFLQLIDMISSRWIDSPLDRTMIRSAKEIFFTLPTIVRYEPPDLCSSGTKYLMLTAGFSFS